MTPRDVRLFYRLMNMHCVDVAPLVSQGLDHELPRAERIAVALHLGICRSCRRYRRQLLLLRSVLAHLGPEVETPPVCLNSTLPPEAREQIKRALQSQNS